MGGESFKIGDPKEVEDGGVKVKVGAGTLAVQGKPLDFLVMVFDGGKKPLRIVAMGVSIKESKGLAALVDSIKK